MKYFDYQYSGNYGEVWELFSDLANLSKDWGKANRNWDYSHTTEIIHSAMNGNLIGNGQEFDLKLYEIKCASTDEIVKNKERDKYLTIVDTVNGSDSGDSNEKVGYGKISINDNRLSTVEDAFELLDSNDEFERCLCDLYNIRRSYIVDKGIDPVEMLLNSLKGIPEAVSSMQSLVKLDNSLGGIVQSLCENGRNSLQFRLEEAF